MAHIVGTNGNDSLVGTSGVDTIEGLGGNDTLVGLGGSDSLLGGLGNDRYVVGTGDVLSDAGGIDTIETAITWHLAAGFENLVATGTASTSHGGNNLANHITGNAGANWIAGREGNDTLLGGAGGDTFNMSNGAGASYGNDSIDGGTGVDTLDFGAAARTAVTVDLQAGTASGGGTGGAGSATLVSIENVNGSAFGDSISGNFLANFLFGFDGDDSLWGGEGADRLEGGAGNDTLDGSINLFAGSEPDVDTLNGGLGNDVFVVDNSADVLIDAGGIDTVIAEDRDWTLGSGFENLVLETDESEGGVTGFGNELDNHMSITWAGNLEGGAGNDTLVAGRAAFGSDHLSGGDGDDLLLGTLFEVLDGGAGNDTLSGGWTTMTGGAGADDFGLQTGADITDFTTGADELILDGALFANVGPSGNFTPNDERFYAAAGATSAHDSTDRLIYNTTTGELYYDRDGAGGDDAAYLAWLEGAPALVATDVEVINGSAGGASITGTPGDDTLTGTHGDDTIDGLGGNDFIDGDQGADSLIGGSGNDTLDSGMFTGFGDGDADTLDGGVGNDEYHVYDDQDTILADPGGIDTVRPHNIGWTLGAGLDNLFAIDTVGTAMVLVGNELNNEIRGASEGGELLGMGGNDLLSPNNGFGSSVARGGDGNDTLNGARDSELFGDAGDDELHASIGSPTVMTGGSGADDFVFRDVGLHQVNDFASGTDTVVLDGEEAFDAIGASGRFAAGDVRFHAAAGATGGHDADDRVVYNTTTGQLFYDADGIGGGAAELIATLQTGATVAATDIVVVNGSAPGGGSTINGTANNDTLVGGAGNDTINGLAGADLLQGLGGNDSIVGGTGWDTLQGGDGADWLHAGGWSDTMTGGAGADSFVWTEAGSNNRDTVTDFASGTDELLFENGTLTAMGAAGAWTAGDGRFWAAAGATAGHEADDRLVYNTTTGNLYYDADGSGAGAAQVVATFTGATGIAATDITVI